ncbi:sigma-70 family RNA polymerase sigma factor [Kroppenstedtia eburnea]|uniref:sigma-70 family RNA polymerase sigma factor n=1 Tax=Kroppenstedtia eburnea TaxID=714067 RepID=UPI00362F809B
MDFERRVMENKNLVFYTVNKFFGRYRPIRADLISLGKIGLVVAAKTYDESKKVSFSSYAVTCIKNEIVAKYFIHHDRAKRKTDQSVLSLEGPTPHSGQFDEKTTLEEIVGTDPDTVSKPAELSILVQQILDMMDPIEREIIERYFGLNGRPEQSRKEIGAELGISSKAVDCRISRLYRRIRREWKEAI